MSVLRRHGYTNIPGSASLKTQKREKDSLLTELEHMPCDAAFAAEVHGEWLASVLHTGARVQIPCEVFDRLLPLQAPLEQVVYLHLFRLCVGKSRNFCRVSRRALGHACQLSDRRLGASLAGLVDKDHIRLVDRNREGTLYRICFVHEVFAEFKSAMVLHPLPVENDGDEAASVGNVLQAPEPSVLEAQKKEAQAPALTKRVLQVDLKSTLATSAPLVSFAEAAKAAVKKEEPALKRAQSASTKALLGQPLSLDSHSASQNAADASSRSAQKALLPTKELLRKPRESASFKGTHSEPDLPPTRTQRDSPGHIASWFLEVYGSKSGSKTQLIEVVFDRLEAGQPFAQIRKELALFAEAKPNESIALLANFLK